MEIKKYSYELHESFIPVQIKYAPSDIYKTIRQCLTTVSMSVV